jgi:hypothetical protein
MGDTKSIGIAYRDQDIDGGSLTNVTLNASILGSTGGTAGFYGKTPVAKAAALTTQLTSLTIADAAGTPDYAIAAITQTTPYGFAAAAEAITVLYVIQNLQVRMAEAESRLKAYGLMT